MIYLTAFGLLVNFLFFITFIRAWISAKFEVQEYQKGSRNRVVSLEIEHKKVLKSCLKYSLVFGINTVIFLIVFVYEIMDRL